MEFSALEEIIDNQLHQEQVDNQREKQISRWFIQRARLAASVRQELSKQADECKLKESVYEVFHAQGNGKKWWTHSGKTSYYGVQIDNIIINASSIAEAVLKLDKYYAAHVRQNSSACKGLIESYIEVVHCNCEYDDAYPVFDKLLTEDLADYVLGEAIKFANEDTLVIELVKDFKIAL